MSTSASTSLPWYRSALVLALVGSILLWAALPPLAIGWLGWLAPVPWLLLVHGETLPGRRPYRAIYLAALAFWLATIHWLRLPHPLVYFGWFILSAYLALYLPVFVGLSRLAVHRLGVPLWLAAPIVWTGLELARAHVMTGFLFCSIAHTQVRWTALIQFSDLVGEYGVDFLMIVVAASWAQATSVLIEAKQGDKETKRQRDVSARSASLSPGLLVFRSLLPAVVAMIAALSYGHFRWNAIQPSTNVKTVRIALIQGNSLADWKFDNEKLVQIMGEYDDLSFKAVQQAREMGDGRAPDLVVWPETMFRVPLISFDTQYRLPPKSEPTKEQIVAGAPRELVRRAAAFGAPLLFGVDRLHFDGPGYTPPADGAGGVSADDTDFKLPPPLAYNSSVLVGRDGQIVGTYDKVHLVMFGEYVPFAHLLPFLNQISSLSGSVEAGEGPVALCTDGVCYAPNICYETVIPHVIRRQVTQLAADGQPADVLVNLTNDAWYWGSCELAQHLACGVFRAVETRRPLVIAANGGISAWIDDRGRVRAQSPIQKPDVIIADVELNGHSSETLYMRAGDCFAGLCLACCVGLAMIGWKQAKTRRPGDRETRRD